jgi:hypothetical protein
MKLFLAEKLPFYQTIDIISEDASVSQNKLAVDTLKLVEKIKDCDAVLVPHDAYEFSKNNEYLKYLKFLSKHKLIIYSDRGDFSIQPKIKNSISLRVSLNPGERRINSVIVPYNIVFRKDIKIRNLSNSPLISFVGYMPKLFSPKRLFKSITQSPFHPILGNGAFVRKLSIQKCANDLPNFNYIKRSSYFTSESNRDIRSVNQLEYLESMRNSDMVLAPRGDANQSVRFYEALSEGRIVLIPNSLMTFPHVLNETQIINSYCLIFNIFSTNLNKLVHGYWSKFASQNHYEKLQRQIRDFYIKELEFTTFIKNLFEKDLNHLKDVAIFQLKQ